MAFDGSTLTRTDGLGGGMATGIGGSGGTWTERVNEGLAKLQPEGETRRGMKLWFVSQAEGGPADLQVLLQQMTAQGWTVANILTNGINRWTVVSSKVA